MQKIDKKNGLAELNESDSSIERVGDTYLTAATSDNTRKAYQSDINHFLKSSRALPTTPIYRVLFKRMCADIKSQNDQKTDYCAEAVSCLSGFGRSH